MKGTKTIVVILGIVIVGALGYYFYTSIEKLDNKQTSYDFTSAQEVVGEFSELDDLGEAELLLESELGDLEALDFEEPITEENIEEVISEAEENEESLDDEIADLETLDF